MKDKIKKVFINIFKNKKNTLVIKALTRANELKDLNAGTPHDWEDLEKYKKIIPCGIKDKGITNLVKIKKKDYSKLGDLLIDKFISNLKK